MVGGKGNRRVELYLYENEFKLYFVVVPAVLAHA